MNLKQTFLALAIGVAAFSAGAYGYARYSETNKPFSVAAPESSIFSQANYQEASVSGSVTDFEKAAAKASPAVVHIKTVMKGRPVSAMPDMDDNPFRDFFGPGFGDRGNPGVAPKQRGSGSGVIVSTDGYIVTNNHVVDQASELTVTLSDNKDYKAKLVGTDPSSDLAVIKIDGKNLPFISFANSDEVRLGQGVLAIGYPLNIGTTVTSGIVSAKSRSIGINSRNSKAPIESFIQTDAAVNPGNSGGALVNAAGDLIGINSAIASPTGSYAGYSYAIPSNLVQKVSSDIIKYGSNKRAYLGVMYANDQLDGEERAMNKVEQGVGIYVMDVASGSAAEAAGVQKGDFITKINGMTVNTGTEMLEKISAMRPGDKISIGFTRKGSEKNATATLKGEPGAYASVKEQAIEQLGASFETLDSRTAASLNIGSGVLVKEIGDGILSQQTRMKEGFIIVKVNDIKVASVEELKNALRQAGNSALITGIYPANPGLAYQYALNDLNGTN